MSNKKNAFDTIAIWSFVLLVISFLVILSMGNQSNSEGGIQILAGFAFFGSIAVISIYIYIFPAMLAHKRNHAQKQAIIWLNILTGWSFIGWVGSLIWALSNPQFVTSRPVGNQESYYQPLTRDDHLSKAPQGEKTCPRCAETVKEAAKVCRYCRHEFS